MRIVAGAWRGRPLLAPPGIATRPTSDRVRQALFDMLWHAPWAGPQAIAGAVVLDAFAGTGALGLEALSRGAARAVFFERDQRALAALRRNVASCGADALARVAAANATRPPPATDRCDLVFLDPPYGQALVPAAVEALQRAGWIAAGALIVAETGRDEPVPVAAPPLADRTHGAARLIVWRWDAAVCRVDAERPGPHGAGMPRERP
ncbi:MAG: 16S rRNA (guanine(966)-N(2))-methyltransferase RsmD [Acetobacteraceae bacterium]|nr:16S rRNA (guanine(966)-N(2))-methyltransferase RsmD [Acetobacteraceae bacterium]